MKKKKFKDRKLRHAVSMPFIWLPLITIIFADLLLEIYHHICFPLYGLPLVQRSSYVRIDRQKLKYLSNYEKLGCMYCGYVNGWLLYASIVAGETEKYWCGIKHENVDEYIEPEHHVDFAEYNDEEEFKKRYLNQ